MAQTSVCGSVFKEQYGVFQQPVKALVLTLFGLVLIFVFVVAPLWLSSLLTNASTRLADRRITTTPKDLATETV